MYYTEEIFSFRNYYWYSVLKYVVLMGSLVYIEIITVSTIRRIINEKTLLVTKAFLQK